MMHSADVSPLSILAHRSINLPDAVRLFPRGQFDLELYWRAEIYVAVLVNILEKANRRHAIEVGIECVRYAMRETRIEHDAVSALLDMIESYLAGATPAEACIAASVPLEASTEPLVKRAKHFTEPARLRADAEAHLCFAAYYVAQAVNVPKATGSAALAAAECLADARRSEDTSLERDDALKRAQAELADFIRSRVPVPQLAQLAVGG